MILKAGLYVVSTPIGNLGDITLRAIETLKNSDVILCEDTRISQKLLVKYQIKNNLRVYNDHSDDKTRQAIVSMIKNGQAISLISDAGTPLISDPGYKLTKLVRENGLHLDIVPGACSIIGALTMSSLPSDRFFFAGFLPKTTNSRKKIFQQLVDLNATLIFFETANRTNDCLQDAYEIFGDRQACVARELTKLYQEVKFEHLSNLIKFNKLYKIKGEIVLLISGQPAKIEQIDFEKKLTNEITKLFSQGLSAKDITKQVSIKYAQYASKKTIYSLANKLKL